MEQTELIYEKTKGLTPFVYTVVNKWLYFCDMHIPQLFRYHFETGEYECVARFNKNSLSFHKIFFYRNELWLLPFLNKEIVCFDINTRKITYYNVPKRIEEKSIPFTNMFFIEEKAYLFPHGKNRFLLTIDLCTYQIEEVQLLKSYQREPVFFTGSIRVQDKIYMIDSSGKRIILYDIRNKEVKSIQETNHLLDNLQPEKIGHNIYFFPIIIGGNEKILTYDTEENCFIKKEYPIKNLLQGEVCITVTFNGEIWILANRQKKIFRINSDLEIKSEIEILNFNEDKKEIYISGVAFEDCFFWNGFEDGTPLVQVKDGVAKILDVCKNQSILEIFIEMIKDCGTHEEKRNKFNIGKTIYDNVLLSSTEK